MTELATRTDVNAKFRESKLDQINAAANKAAWLRDQIDSGAMKDLGNDRYMVMTGWDKGETFRVNLTDNSADVIANHGLDVKANGDVALYVKDVPAWHALGTCIPGGLTNVNGVLTAAGLNWETLLTVQEGTNPVTGERDERADAFHTRRGDTGEILGSVGKIYTPVHNHQAYAFLEELFRGNGNDALMIPESAGSFGNGSRVFITAEVPSTLLIDPNGFRDHIRQFVAIINSHNGTSPLIAVTTPWRIECANTERFAVRDAVSKWTVRHTRNACTKLEMAKQTLGLTTAYYAEWAKEETALAQTPFHDNQIDALCDEVWGEIKSDAKRTVTRDANRKEAVRNIFRMEAERVGSTAYAAERAITGYVDHFAELRPRGVLKGNMLGARGAAIMDGSNDDTKSKAHAKLMVLTNR